MTLDKGTTCSSWNYCGQRMAAGSTNGMIAIHDSTEPGSSSFSCTSRFKVCTHLSRAISLFYVQKVAQMSLDTDSSLW